MKFKVEVAIVGGGMVGAALACGLTKNGFEVALLEKQKPLLFDPDSHPNLRISAINAASIRFLRQLGVWKDVLRMRCAPYRRQEVWECQKTKLRFDSKLLGLPELGYMVENHVLQYALWKHLWKENIYLLCPAFLQSMYRVNNQWELLLNNGDKLQAQLVIGVDGADSQICKLAGIRKKSWIYKQSCMLISVNCEDQAGDLAWQQFTPHGPRAFLPLFGCWASLVWYDKPDWIQHLQSMRMLALQHEIHSNFPLQLGRVTPVLSSSFLLTRSYVTHYILPGLALAGDAAHTIHPLAGQGVNLGYRDAIALIEILSKAKVQAIKWFGKDVLEAYQYKRQSDNWIMQNGMDFLYHTFSKKFIPLKVLRNAGLLITENSIWIKYKILSYMLGI
ncbi:2-octaprenyl-3-methyl-6-methoxy-1,4-benzoquinol hydroxylase [Candidatus Erwinia haradaeae]|uniref:2-octaprenyl-3-methyl-6-methoxy-1,4-benzoquinol hydroxylase n=1 Tax=Candidatus Erwinia haradaeae TaxID=1922217 RepID=A0A803FTZ3_9GAMM|nr:2-octaprenyl-3-methyl-6-methoxy-1,4-benzoquinol hydroxylase [Candidatus Erwinia haradaeae]